MGVVLDIQSFHFLAACHPISPAVIPRVIVRTVIFTNFFLHAGKASMGEKGCVSDLYANQPIAK